MPLTSIDAARELFATILATDQQGKFQLDHAFARVIEHAYESGLEAGRHANETALRHLARDLLDPDMYGHAVSEEIRHAARRALGIKPVRQL